MEKKKQKTFVLASALIHHYNSTTHHNMGLFSVLFCFDLKDYFHLFSVKENDLKACRLKLA